MLVLTRRVNESIRIGDEIVVTITRLTEGRVGVGIEAPSHHRILRDELTGEPPDGLNGLVRRDGLAAGVGNGRRAGELNLDTHRPHVAPVEQV